MQSTGKVPDTRVFFNASLFPEDLRLCCFNLPDHWEWLSWDCHMHVYVCVCGWVGVRVYMRVPYLLCVSGWYMKLNLSVGCPLAILAVCKWGRSGSGYANLKLKQREVMITTNTGRRGGKIKINKTERSKHQCNSKMISGSSGEGTVILTVCLSECLL